jgi:hypothetical protein
MELLELLVGVAILPPLLDLVAGAGIKSGASTTT